MRFVLFSFVCFFFFFFLRVLVSPVPIPQKVISFTLRLKQKKIDFAASTIYKTCHLILGDITARSEHHKRSRQLPSSLIRDSNHSDVLDVWMGQEQRLQLGWRHLAMWRVRGWGGGGGGWRANGEQKIL